MTTLLLFPRPRITVGTRQMWFLLGVEEYFLDNLERTRFPWSLVLPGPP